MKVFISSVMTGFEAERESAARAARMLGHEARLAEDFPAMAETPQAACLAGVRWANVVVLLLGERYGAIQASGLSATHEEFKEASDRDVLGFIQRGAAPEPAQRAFIDEVQDYTSGTITFPFGSPSELHDAVARALHDLELGRQAGAPDDDEILARARAKLGHSLVRSGPRLTLVVASGPLQPVVRPSRLEAKELREELIKEALFGPNRLFTTEAATNEELRDDGLHLTQEGADILLDGSGSVRISRTLVEATGRQSLPAIIEEEVSAFLENGLAFIADVLDEIDQPHRLTRAVPIVELEHANQPWRTRAEQTSSPNASTIPWLYEPRIAAQLSPPGRHRAALHRDRVELSADLLTLLRRKLRG